MHGEQDRKACNGDENWDQREDKAVFEVVGGCGDEHSESEGAGPRGDGAELCLDGGVAELFNDCGGEVSVTVGRDNKAEVHESANENFI